VKSPFPGIDPYLEDPAFWEDFHRRFITVIADALLAELPPSYDAQIDERVRLVEADSERAGSRLPDVSVDWINRPQSSAGGTPAETAGSAVLTPVAIPMPALEEYRDVWVEVVHLPERNLVTAIEVLSPTNKTDEGAAVYHNTRIELYTRHVNLVEIDLLRGGDRLSLAKPLPPGDYYAFVARDQRRPLVDVYAWGLRGPLPTVPIPLLPQDGDVNLNLAEVFASTYERGRYAQRLRYERPVSPPVPEADRAWVSALAAGKS